MRVMRVTYYSSGLEALFTTVVRDSDVVDTLEAVRERITDEPEGIPDDVLRPYIAFDIFEMDDGGIEQATKVAFERLDDELAMRERDAAILFFFAIDSILPMLTPTGMYLVPNPSPLSATEIAEVLRQIAKHKTYQHQRIDVPDETGTRVVLSDGKVTD